MFLASFDAGDSLQNAFTELVAFLPNLIGALLLLLLGYFVAKVLDGLARRALQRAEFDRAIHREPTGEWIKRVIPRPSNLAGTIVFWVVFLGAVSIAVDVLGIEALENLVAAIYGYLPNVLAALLIFIVAVAVAAGVATLANRLMGDTSLGRIISTAAPILVFAIATFMILDQLKIAESIVTITYAGLIGALALGSALAFGLGGRDVAAQLLQGAYAKGQENKAQLKRELELGKERAKQEAEKIKDDKLGSADLDTAETQVVEP
jgi:Mechanosensitive ion channel, conserved TM helix